MSKKYQYNFCWSTCSVISTCRKALSIVFAGCWTSLPKQHGSILSSGFQSRVNYLSKTFSFFQLRSQSTACFLTRRLFCLKIMFFFASESWQAENAKNAIDNYRSNLGFPIHKPLKLPAWSFPSGFSWKLSTWGVLNRKIVDLVISVGNWWCKNGY